MTDTPQQPDEADAMSLDDQLDKLLANIEKQEPGTISSPASETPSVKVEPLAELEATSPLDELIDQKVDDAIAEAEQLAQTTKEAVAEDVTEESPREVGDELADQIQALLDDTKDAEAAAPVDAAMSEAAATVELAEGADEAITEALEDVAEDLAEAPAEERAIETSEGDLMEGSFETPDVVVADTPVVEPDAGEQIEELDHILAESADEAIAGDFETIEQVVAPAQVAEQASERSDAEAVAESSQDVVATSQAVGATAKDVAAELDAQPEDAPLPPESAVIAATPMQPAGRLDKLAAMMPKVRVMERRALHICSIINQPLGRLNPQWRNLVGYVGLLTLANALAMIVFAMIF